MILEMFFAVLSVFVQTFTILPGIGRKPCFSCRALRQSSENLNTFIASFMV